MLYGDDSKSKFSVTYFILRYNYLVSGFAACGDGECSTQLLEVPLILFWLFSLLSKMYSNYY